MTIKHRTTLSATIILAFIALTACQQKTEAPNNQERQKVPTNVEESKNFVVSESAKEIESKAEIGLEDTQIMIEAGDKKKEETSDNLDKIDLSSISEAELILDIFEVNGEAYSNKVLIVNDVQIGLLPNSIPPVESWQTVSVKLSNDAINALCLTNAIGIVDDTQDAYNIRNIQLKIKLKNIDNPLVFSTTNSFSSVSNWWPFKQGKTIKLDGTPFTFIYVK